MTIDPTVSMAAYRGVRTRVSDLLADVDDGTASVTPVPGCPEWTVTDLAGHLCGVCVDILEGNLDGVGTARWADAQAQRFAPLGLSDVLARWNEVGPQVEAIGEQFPAAPATQLVFDATTHEHDARGALGSTDARDSACLAVPLEFISTNLDTYVRGGGMATLRLTAPDGWSFTAGEGEPGVELRATTFEVFRSFAGRRSLDQIRRLDWTGDPEPYLTWFEGSPLVPPSESLIE